MEEWYEEGEGYYSEVPSIFCPICQMDEIMQSDVIKYLYKSTHTTFEKVKAKILTRFKSYDELQQYLKEVK